MDGQITEYSPRELKWIKRCIDDHFKKTKWKPLDNFETELYLFESDGRFRYEVDILSGRHVQTDRYFGEFEHDVKADIMILKFSNINEEWQVKL